MRTRALAALAATVILSSVTVAPADAGLRPPSARALHWRTFVTLGGARLQGCVERPAGTNHRYMHFRHDTRLANGTTRVKVVENFSGVIATIWKDPLTAPGHVIASGRIGFLGEAHRFTGAIVSRSGARATGSLRIADFPTC